MSNVMSLPQVGPFVGVSEDKIFTPKGGDRRLRVLVYGAYNARGLIGSEMNGVAILDEDNKQVLVDNLGREGSGYFGASNAQRKLFKRITEDMSWKEIKDMIETSPNDRGAL